MRICGRIWVVSIVRELDVPLAGRIETRDKRPLSDYRPKDEPALLDTPKRYSFDTILN